MNAMFSIVLTAHILVGLGVIGLVLLQHGKGADMGAAFGSGASGSLFGATGSANFLSRATAALATVFFVTSLSLAYMAGKRPAAEGASVMDAVKVESTVPAKEESTPPTPAAADAKAKDVDVKAKVDNSKVKEGDSKAKEIPK